MTAMRERTAYQCEVCGKVYLTWGGARRHREQCRERTPKCDGQMSIEDFVAEERKDHENTVLEH